MRSTPRRLRLLLLILFVLFIFILRINLLPLCFVSQAEEQKCDSEIVSLQRVDIEDRIPNLAINVQDETRHTLRLHLAMFGG